jgi:preprotein translocase subunit Sec61beta
MGKSESGKSSKDPMMIVGIAVPLALLVLIISIFIGAKIKEDFF